MTTHQKLERTIAAEQQALHNPDSRVSARKLTGSGLIYGFKRALQQFSADKGTDRAATLTYFAVLSLAPMLLAVFSILTLVLASAAGTVENFAEDLVTQAVPADYQDLALNLVTTMTESAGGGVIALIVGTLVALWSASKYIQAFARTLNEIYGVVEGRSIVKLYLTMLGLTLLTVLTVVALLVSLALNATLVETVFAPIAQVVGAESTLAALTETFLPVWQWVKYPVMLLLIVLLLGVLYQFSANVERRFKPLSIGAAFAVVGIILAGIAMVIYLTYFASYSSYGAIGSLMAVLFVIWIFNIVIILGAEIDIELLRARQLVAGIDAEEQLRIRPRSVATVEKQHQKYAQTVEEGEVLRRSLAGL